MGVAAAAVLGLAREAASLAAAVPGLPRASAPVGGGGTTAAGLSTLLVAGRLCFAAGLAGSGSDKWTGEFLKSAAAERLLVSSLEVSAVGEKLTMGLDVSR